jgi:predicted transposase YbfD/YdcC
VIADPAFLIHLQDAGEWKGLQAVVKVHTRRQLGEETTEKARYFISSQASGAKHLLEAIRTHWNIENELHWVLDSPSMKMRDASGKTMDPRISLFCGILR